MWDTGFHYGDWLGLDAPEGSYKGSTSEYLIATAFFAYSTSIFVKAGKALQKDMCEYEDLHTRIKSAYQKKFMPDSKLTSDTQTAHAITLSFDLCENKSAIADRLAYLVNENDNRIKTGFVGTPFILHALSENGYQDLAYALLLQEESPSWLFPVTQGATTIWEHWDGIRKDGSMWSADMNSFNHYSYGAVADWIYSVIGGITPCEAQPGYKHFNLKPLANKRLNYAEVSFTTAYGKIISSWKWEGNTVSYDFTVPKGTTAMLTLNGQSYKLASGNHKY